jgi:hypothetical protein
MSPRGIPFFCCLVVLLGCQVPNPGIAPVPATLNFPIAVGLTAPADVNHPSDFLLVVNANYDARYNQGTILSLDMREIMRRFDSVRTNGRFPQGMNLGCTNPAAWDDPNIECQIGEAIDVMARGTDGLHQGAEVWIDSFAASIVLSPQGDRFYIPTRGTANLTWIDIDTTNGAIGCEQADGSFRCSAHRRTTLVDTCGDRDLTMTGDPNALTVVRLDTITGDPQDANRDAIVMLQRNGNATLFLDHTSTSALGREPWRTHVLTGLPPDTINAELEPSSGLSWLNTSSPVSSRATSSLSRVGVFIDPSHRECSEVFAAPSVFLDGLATGFDSRDSAFGTGDNARYAYVLSRSPESIITIDQNGTPFIPGNAAIVDVDDVGFGPSRMRRFTMDGRDFLLVTCFDGGNVWAFRTQPTEVASVVPGFDGAYEMVIDEQRQLAIVADFKTSVIRFIDLSPLLIGRNAVDLGRVGTPRTHVGFP